MPPRSQIGFALQTFGTNPGVQISFSVQTKVLLVIAAPPVLYLNTCAQSSPVLFVLFLSQP